MSETTLDALFCRLVGEVHAVYKAAKANNADAIVFACVEITDIAAAIARKAAGMQ